MFALVKASRRRGEHGDRVDAGGLGASQAALVRHEHRDSERPASTRERGHQRHRHRRAAGWRCGETKRRRLDLAQAGVGEERDEAGLGRGRDRRRFVLEAVARADLVDPDAAGAGSVTPVEPQRAAGPSPARSGRSRPRSARSGRSRRACSSLPCGAALRRLRVSRCSASSSSRVCGRGGSSVGLGMRRLRAWPRSLPRRGAYRVRARRSPSDLAARHLVAERDGELGDGARRSARPPRAPSSSPRASRSASPAYDGARRRRHRRRGPPGHRGDELHGPAAVWAAASRPPRVDVRRRARSGTATLRPATSTWTVSPTTTREARHRGVVVRRGGPSLALGLEADGAARALSRQPPRHGSAAAVAGRGVSGRASGRCRPGVVRDARPLRPVVRRPDPLKRVDARLAVAHTGSRTSQRRNRRFVVSPRTTRLVEGRRQAIQRLVAVAPWAMTLASIGSNRPPTSSPSSTPASTRMPGPDGQRSRSMRPVAGRNPASASSAYSRTSIAWPPQPRRRACVEPERLAGGDPQLVLDEVAAGDELGDRMLDLEPRVHLEEGELAAVVEQELARAGATYPTALASVQRGLAQPPPERRDRPPATASPRGPSGAAAGSSSRARRGGRRCRGRRRAPGSRRGAALRPTARGSAARRRMPRSPRDGRRRARPRSRSGSRTVRMPLPPPPAAGLTRTGKPIRCGGRGERRVGLVGVVVAGRRPGCRARRRGGGRRPCRPSPGSRPAAGRPSAARRRSRPRRRRRSRRGTRSRGGRASAPGCDRRRDDRRRCRAGRARPGPSVTGTIARMPSRGTSAGCARAISPRLAMNSGRIGSGPGGSLGCGSLGERQTRQSRQTRHASGLRRVARAADRSRSSAGRTWSSPRGARSLRWDSVRRHRWRDCRRSVWRQGVTQTEHPHDQQRERVGDR